MSWDGDHKPRLRPVEAFRPSTLDEGMVALRDRSGLSDVVLSMSAPALHLLSMMDGNHTCEEIRSGFFATFGQSISIETLQSILDHLGTAHLLEGGSFEAHYDSLLTAYRERGVRAMPLAAGYGLVDSSGDLFREMLRADGSSVRVPENQIRGIIAPHLDYSRGANCYAAAYGAIQHRAAPDRVVVLGTNHFGRSTAVVATANAFETPLGRTPCDKEFLDRLQERCGDLRRYELDHQREHSVELQVAWLQYLFGASNFRIVPVLCPNPCGPTGTAPLDGQGVDLREFAVALGELVSDDSADTLLVAGADLSHVGEDFGDDPPIDHAYLARIGEHDRGALRHLELGEPEAFVRYLYERENRTRVCSAGCIFVLAVALEAVRATILRYDQAIDSERRNCVTCAAALFA